MLPFGTEASTYECYVGLMLNMARQWWRESALHERGARASRSNEALPLVFYDALAPDEETARNSHFDGNAARFLAKAKRAADAMMRKR